MVKKNSPKSVSDYYRVIRRFFSWLVQEGRLKDNPMQRMRCPRVPKKVVKVFTPEHIRKILLLCEDSTKTGIRNKAMVLVLLDTGIRKGELAGIKVGDIDVRRGIITVRVPSRGSSASASRPCGPSSPTTRPARAIIRSSG